MASPKLCDEKTFNDLVSALESGAKDDIERTDRLLGEFPDDPRLHFLRGSVLAGIGRSIEALPALKKAVELAPDLAIARFQLGFFLLTSGDASEALSIWGPLALLPEGDYLRLFVAGLTHLIRDEFGDAVKFLREGITANIENSPLNRDMSVLIDQIDNLAMKAAEQPSGDISATSLLLGQHAPRRTTH